jgi:GR25 family glycosyltransferase involved in LPS biosynthesis
MDCIVINMDKDTERWATVDKVLTDAGFEHRRFAAINGKEIGSEYDEILIPGTRSFVPKGVLGSALSHKLAVADFSARNEHEWCLLLEDDVLAHPKARKRIEHLIKNAPEDCDVIKLTSSPEALAYREGPLLKKKKFTVDACAQLIRRKGAQKILKYKIFFPGYADVTPWFMPNLQVYVVRKDYVTFYQTWEGESNNAGKRYPDFRLNFKVLKLGPTDIELTTGDILVLIAAGILIWGGTSLIGNTKRLGGKKYR